MDDKLFITRKRKKWKFYHFNEWSNCWQAEDINKKVIKDYIGARKLTLEIAAGTADLSVELARRYPKECFIATDIKSDRLYTGAKVALSEKLDNVRFLRVTASQLIDLLPEYCVDTLWITFPDPFPRKGDAKHRLTHPVFLALYKQLLKPAGVIKLKTDNQKLFDWSLDQFKIAGWQIKEITRDLHTSALSDDYKITTTYERKFIQHGQKICFAGFKRS